MDSNEKLLDLISEQRELTDKYEKIIKEITSDDHLSTIDNLKNEVDKLNLELNKIEKKYLEQVDENLSLKTSLKEQIFNEKIGILNASKRKIELYFNSAERANDNKLRQIEMAAEKRIHEAIKISNKELQEESRDISIKLNEIERQLKDSILKKKESLNQQKNNILTDLKKEYEDLKNEEIDEKLIQRRKKQNDIEVKIGLNLINKIGIILLILGVATGMKYTYSNWFGVYLKSILGFAFGVLFLSLGEWFNKKEKNIFSLGMCAAGLGILYVAVFNSYFILQTLSLGASLVMYLLITIVSVLFSIRYQSQTISAISLIGGYISLFNYMAFEIPENFSIYVAMIYLLILNYSILILSKDRRWTFVKYLSFFLNIPVSLFLIGISSSNVVSLFYSLSTFIMYLAIILINPINQNKKLKLSEIILLGLNTSINALITYRIFYLLAWNDLNGLLALIYGIIYFYLASFISKKNPDDKMTPDLFYITSLTFSILMIPMQFGLKWISIGWLIQAVLLIDLFKRKYEKEKKLELAGWIIFGLSIFSFISLEFFSFIDITFITKYTLITGSLLYILKLYAPDIKELGSLNKIRKNDFLNIYKYFVVIFTWIYSLRMSFLLYENFIDTNFYYASFFLPVIFALVTGLYAYGISNIDILKDKVISWLSIAMYLMVNLTGLFLTGSSLAIIPDSKIRVFATFILLVYNVFIFFNLKTLTLMLIEKLKLTLEILPIVMSIYLLGIIPLFLINQFNFQNINLIISILFIVLSFAYILYGFKKDFLLIRRFGLALSMFSTAKLFIFDLLFLNILGRIIAYLSFGLTLISISFMYQRLKSISDENTSKEGDI